MAPPSKRRKVDALRRQKPVEELTFSIDARQEYLTGFSKRKQARKEQAREQAIKEAKEEKIRDRKELREQRKVDLETHVAEVNKVLKEQDALARGKDPDDIDSDASDEFRGFNDSTTQPETAGEELPDDAEYVDEDKYTTVTVEAMDESEDEEAVAERAAAEKAKYAKIEAEKATELAEKRKKRPWLKDGQEKQKKKKFRYESKAERSLTRQKQKSKNSKAAKERRGKDK
ncbi:Putative nucleolar protein [Septoria linicola]|uniref:Nucleolar protein n=1 Tax=Septoria linicola TaxID=215465 RepID=A0A9Q9B225_9PEZI|nr:putative nucleolar protein [Septoria linicola]USW57488.1 Putative nucleolar protein [Septoria linicola]